MTEAFTLRERQFTSVRVKSEGRKYDFGSSITLDKKNKNYNKYRGRKLNDFQNFHLHQTSNYIFSGFVIRLLLENTNEKEQLEEVVSHRKKYINI